MADTNLENILAIAPELSGVPQSTVALILADVAGQVKAAVYGEKQERAQRYLAAHLLTLVSAGTIGGAVVSEKTGDVSTTYAAPGNGGYDETAYGREFQRIRRGCVLPFMTVKP